MKREIKFGERHAVINIGDNHAVLSISGTTLPVILADTLNDSGDLSVTRISNDMNESIIRIVHDLPKSEILHIVCEAISQVYDIDTSISYARSEEAI